MKPLISACIISGNEGFDASLPWHPSPGIPIIERMLVSLKQSGINDEFIISWNGTRIDDLKAVIKNLGITDSTNIFFRPWELDFSAAFNHSFECAKGLFKFYFDTDDIISWKFGAFRRFLSNRHTGSDIVTMPYHQEIDENGFVRTIVNTPRGCSGDFKFEGRMHAVLSVSGKNFNTIHWDKPVKHYPTSPQTRSERNLKILRLEYQDQIARYGHATFKTLVELGRTAPAKEAIEYNIKALSISKSKEEKFLILRNMARRCIVEKQFERAKHYASKMLDELPSRAEPHFINCICLYEDEDYYGVINSWDIALKSSRDIMAMELVTERTKAMLCAALSMIKMNQKDKALKLVCELKSITKDPGLDRIIEAISS